MDAEIIDPLFLMLMQINRARTERKESAPRGEIAEQGYQILFENNPLPMWVYDLETLQFLAVNEAAVHHYGYSRDEFLGMTIREIRPADELDALTEDLAQTGPGLVAESPRIWKHRSKNGAIIQVEITSHDLVFERRPARLEST